MVAVEISAASAIVAGLITTVCIMVAKAWLNSTSKFFLVLNI